MGVCVCVCIEQVLAIWCVPSLSEQSYYRSHKTTWHSQVIHMDWLAGTFVFTKHDFSCFALIYLVLFRGRPSHVKTVGNWEDDQESQSSGISSVGDRGSSIVDMIKTTAGEGSSDCSWEVMDKQSTSNRGADKGTKVPTTEAETLENASEDVQEEADVEAEKEVEEDDENASKEEAEEVVDGVAGAMETDIQPLVPEGEELRQRLKDPDTTHQ